MELADWADYAFGLAAKAGESIMTYYAQVDPVVPTYKPDNSPLTIADQSSHEIIQQGLATYELDGKPAVIISEEGNVVPFVERQQCTYCWYVDPLDGTKDFLARNNEFTVNIALVQNHKPIVGVVYVPAQKVGYVAWQNGGAYRWALGGSKERIVTQQPAAQPLRVLVSRQYSIETVQPWLSKLGETRLLQQGSALKFCVLASGQADLFLRLSPTSEWDNAAGHCILEEAGGSVFTFNSEPLLYNRSGTLEQGRFLAVGTQSPLWEKLLNR